MENQLSERDLENETRLKKLNDLNRHIYETMEIFTDKRSIVITLGKAADVIDEGISIFKRFINNT